MSVSRTTITRRIEIDAGHRIPNHESKCRNLHGHRYVVEVTISGDVKPERGESDDGMIVDFGSLKDLMMQVIHDPWDHAFLVWNEDPVVAIFDNSELFSNHKTIYLPFVPTVENLCLDVFQQMCEHLDGTAFQVDSVTMWETPNCRATVVAKQA